MILTSPHFSNCLIYALKQRKRIKFEWVKGAPHWYVEDSEFVAGNFSRNALYPFWFMGYGVARQ